SAPRGALLYLGGDLMHAARLARRLDLPALAYLERGSGWTRFFDRLLVADDEGRRRVVRHGAAEHRVHRVGNLMVDAVQPAVAPERAATRFAVDVRRPVVAVFPGSRPYEIEISLPFLLR